MNAKQLILLVFVLLLASATAYAEWGNIRIVYFVAGKALIAHGYVLVPLKTLALTRTIATTMQNFWSKSASKGQSIIKEFKVIRRSAAKEIDYLRSYLLSEFDGEGKIDEPSDENGGDRFILDRYSLLKLHLS